MMLEETETGASFERLPDELRTYITRYLDTPSLCFFAATSWRSLGNALEELHKRQRRMLAQIHQYIIGVRTFCYTSHSLYVFGDNKYGQLGLGHTNHCNQLTQAENMPGTILQVVTGYYHTLVLTDQGLYACGGNENGQLGLGHNNNCNQLTRVENVPGIILQVVVCGDHTFVLTDQGLYACGRNKNGQLGLGHYNDCNLLTRVENVPGIILQIAACRDHTFVLTDQGLYACGSNKDGQLGLGHYNDCNQLALVEDVPGTILQVVAGDTHTFVLTDQGLYACGYNSYGQLGLGHYNNCNQLTWVKNVPGTILQVVVTDFFYTLVLTDQGLYTCGHNSFGQLGLGHTKKKRNQLRRVEDVPGTILQVVAGRTHTVVLTDQGLYACGHNMRGQLGLGHYNNCNQLTRVESVSGTILQVMANNIHTFVLTEQGLYACGDNEFGQLRLGVKKTDSSSTPLFGYGCGYSEWLSQQSVGDKETYSTFTLLSELPLELKQSFSILQHIRHLITISTSDIAREQDDSGISKDEHALPVAQKKRQSQLYAASESGLFALSSREKRKNRLQEEEPSSLATSDITLPCATSQQATRVNEKNKKHKKGKSKKQRNAKSTLPMRGCRMS